MNTKAERRKMQIHPKAIWDLIHEQAGTIGKAILEGAMNSVDAGATECRIEIDREQFSIVDDGKGFANDEEILNFFDTFAYPHENGDAKYGRYRMGRGQIMSFGVNKWHTNNYKMHVDFKPQENNDVNNYELGYDFYRTDENYPGCKIEVQLYDKLAPSLLDSVLREIQGFVKYIEVPIYLNGKLISIDPKTETWDEITDDAYIKRKGGGTLDIYNQGALVSQMSQYYAGTSGVIVSKVPLSLNTARNQVKASCPVFKRILKNLKDENMETLKRKTPLNDRQRDFFARELSSGSTNIKALDDARIITDITNSHHPVSIFANLTKFQNRVSIAERGDRVAEMAHTRRLGFVVTTEMAERFNARTPVELVGKISEIYAVNGQHLPQLVAVDVDEFKNVISSRHEPLEEKELNKAERIALKGLRKASEYMYRVGTYLDYRDSSDRFNKGHTSSQRKIHVGMSDTALAWTDGTHNIWFDKKVLRAVSDGYPGMNKLCGILLHEYLHNGPSTNTHEHGVEFYNRFHDLSVHTTLIPETASVLMRTVIKELKNDGKHLVQKLASYEDMDAKATDLGMKHKTLVEENEFIENNDNNSVSELLPSVGLNKPATISKDEKKTDQISMKF